MRLFFAVELPADVQAALGRLRPEDDGGGYRWVDPAWLHVTLAFLGEQPPDRLPLLEQIGRAAADAGEPGVLRVGPPGQFGSRGAPRVLWLGVDGDVPALLQLHAGLASSLAGAGFAVEDAPYRPHITLARRRSTARGGAPPGWPPDRVPRTAFPMDHLTLFESRLSPRGATYVVVGQFPLG